MTAWRMSFRCGDKGYEYEMWPACLRLGVAAITYSPLFKTDLTKYPKGEPKKLWASLAPTQKARLRRVAYEMKAGDVIYVKQGPKIVCKGVVKGLYQFDSKFRLKTPDCGLWGAHQVPVEWEPDFAEIEVQLGKNQQLTVEKLTQEDVQRVEDAIGLASTVTQDLDSQRIEEEKSFEEGGPKQRYTNYYERNQRLRVATIKCHGKNCMVCGFNFGKVYGKHGIDYIEVHHLLPVSSLKEETKFYPKTEMAVVCSNCHRMIHRKKDKVLSLEKMRGLIRK